MVYVARDGTIYQDQPWGIKKVMGIISGIINMVFAFFQTLIPIESSNPRNNFRNSNGHSSGGGYPRPPGPPRPGSNIHGLDSGPPEPPPACGSCCGR